MLDSVSGRLSQEKIDPATDPELYAQQYASQGRPEAANAFSRLNERGVDAARKVGEIFGTIEEISGAVDRFPGARLIAQGFRAVFVMLVLVVVASLISPALTIALAFLTMAVVLVYAYAYWVETRWPALNPTLLFLSIFLTVGLAILAIISSLFI